MYRYTDEMGLPDYQRSIVKAEDRPDATPALKPGLNMPTLLDDPDLFFYDVTANEDGTLTVVGHGDPRRTTSDYAHYVFCPEMTEPGRVGYLSLAAGDHVRISAPKADAIQADCDLGVATFPASVVVAYHRDLDAPAVKAYYEGPKA